ncbi:Qat anti-phage system TatD family nuclease QatD [Chromobacterium alticapitis]|uniref:Hydrolase TatD n=1 Tax=Chromobacterium alticapitis TaxID=2073169 RepID=A0A2S5DC95_9NEIS|nr:Qat anti-phage system TatD family nuclease QatD [Chromobacterium alticapitis]POZ60705.1 hydrolase TatD [Chromobacterium alticapitis]
MTKGLVDFHCHLDLYPDFAEAVSKAEAAGIYTLTVTTTPQAWPRNRDLTKPSRYVRAALGLHPQLVAERADEISLFEKYVGDTRYIGEVGLDASPRFYHSIDLQKQVFERVLRCCAEAGNKILTIHSVRSAKAVLDMIEHTLSPDRGKIVLHWFTGSAAEARRATAMGCYFSVNATMAASERGKALVESLPFGRLLTETDGPFTKIDGRPTQPSDVSTTVDLIAKIRGQNSVEVAMGIQENLRQLVGTP